MRDRLIEFLKDSLNKHIGKSCLLAENIADDLLANGAIVPPCKVGDEINGEVVCEMLYSETLGIEGNIRRNKQAYTCDKADTEKKIRVEHPMTWEKVEQALRKEDDGK